MKKGWIIVGLLAVLVAGALAWRYAARRAELALMPYWTGEYPDWVPEGIEEPPISEQIEAQIESIETGQDVPLPIPFYIAGEKIDRLELHWLREKLKALGYVEIEGGDEDSREVTGWWEYAHPDYREMLILSYMNFNTDRGLVSLMVFPRSATRVSKDSNLDAVLEIVGDQVGFFVGRIHLGMPLSKVEERLVSVPHSSIDSSEINNLNNVGDLESPDGDEPLQGGFSGQLSFTDFMRGRYMYSLKFSSGKLEYVFTTSISDDSPREERKLTDEQMRRLVTSSFDKES